MTKTNADIIHTITLGWKCRPTSQVAHYWKSNTFAKMAMSSCGRIATKSYLMTKSTAMRCVHCQWKRQHRQDIKPFVEKS